MVAFDMIFLAFLTSVEVVLTSNDMSFYDPSPLTAHDVSAYVDRSVTLRCQLKTGSHSRGWYVITWQKINNDGSRTSLVNLPVRQKIPEWSKDVPSSLQTRIQPIITVQPNHVEFNLLITNVTCADEGEYRCIALTPQGEITSAAELNIVGGARHPTDILECALEYNNVENPWSNVTLQLYVNMTEPGRPEIMNEFIPKMEHGLITLECRAMVGLPTRMLLWYYKEPGATYFSMLNNQRDIIHETDGCHVISTRSVDVIISAQSRGTHYRCGYRNLIEKPGLYDELVYRHEETAPQLGEVREEPKMTSSCDGHASCQNDEKITEESSNQGNSRNGAASFVSMTSSTRCSSRALYFILSSLLYHIHFRVSLMIT